MDTATISLRARATGSGLCLHFWLDGQRIGSLQLGLEPQQFQHEFRDDASLHEFGIELQGKTHEHTVLDAQGVILHDVVAEIDQMALDGIMLGHAFHHNSRYCHDHNGTTDPVETGFFGTMGCNGRVSMQFSSPVYLWLLENM